MEQQNNLFGDTMFLTDGGLETTLIFHYGLELRSFAAFELLNTPDGRAALQKYYKPYLDMATKYSAGFVLETPTWRSNTDWATKLGYTKDELQAINMDAVAFVKDIAKQHAGTSPIIISGNIGPRGDGYNAENMMGIEEAKAYHAEQIRAFKSAGADVVTALTMNYSNEAIGVALASKQLEIPCVLSFTVETDGKLPDGETLEEAIEKTEVATGNYPLHYMINCAHPDHFKNRLSDSSPYLKKIKGIRANASTMSHAELDEAENLDAGDKDLLAHGYAVIKSVLPGIRVIGGCCGTDHSHIEQICQHIF